MTVVIDGQTALNGRERQRDEEDIASEDLDLGEDVTDQFEVRRPLGVVMPVRLRLSRAESLQLDEMARRSGMSRTDIVLASLRATLTAGEPPAPVPVSTSRRP